MCVNCGGTCKGKRRRPRFVEPAASPTLEIKGTAGGVDHIPDNLIEQRGGMITYETLYTAMGPDGQPAAAVIPGTFGSYATRALLERGR